MTSILNVKDVTQIFGGLVALSDINIHVEEREILGIIGPNGAGKTTLFNAITGIIPPKKGTIELVGMDITNKKPYEITSLGFARTFQNIRLFKKMTVLDNVLVGMHTKTKSNLYDALFCTPTAKKEKIVSEQRALEILEMLGLYEHRYDLAKNLPYGSQRKLEIARALGAEPILLLLDEPAAGMNEQETKELAEIIKKLKSIGNTILLIEHDMKFVMNICERIYVLNYGIQIGEGTPKEVSRNAEVIAAYLGKEV